MFTPNKIKQLESYETPFYYYDLDLLDQTLVDLASATDKHDFHVHYALKANVNSDILMRIHAAGLGADCVSGNEILHALKCGFSPKDDIKCFNCESIAEMEILNMLAAGVGKSAEIALRINPEVDAKTHKYITTGLQENKFGIHLSMLDAALSALKNLPNLKLVGIHMHIGSQVTDLEVFRRLALRANELQNRFEDKVITRQHLNLGG